MASNGDLRLIRVVLLLVLLSTIVQVLVTFFAVTRVNRAKAQYQVTSQDFARNVNSAVGEFLTNYVENKTAETNDVSTSLEVVQEFLEGACVWQSPRRGMLFRLRGNDYTVGDYYGNGLVVGIHPGKIYVREKSRVVIYRPSPETSDELLAARRRSGADGDGAL